MRLVRKSAILLIIIVCSVSLKAQKKSQVVPEGFPKPGRVALQSTMVPGWGQVTNKQWWKVPLVYGGLAGLVYYNINQANTYKDYRAAVYNLNNPAGDQRFGPTPAYLQSSTNESFLRFTRNNARNQRDISYVYIGLFYGLNVLDAYIFAHLRPFDVGDDLSLAPSLHPSMQHINGQIAPSISFQLGF